MTITDNDAAGATNPVLSTPFFVRQHYLDFLSREPEEGEPWSGVLNKCPNVFNLDPNSLSAACDRITVSTSFFGSPEFRLKGFYVFKFYRVAFERLPTYEEIVADMRSVTAATESEVYARRTAFALHFTERDEFRTRFDNRSSEAYVDMLLRAYGLDKITTQDPHQPEQATKVTLNRNSLIFGLESPGIFRLTRGQVLRAIVESDEVAAAEYNHAFVAMQYYGYLRRTPEQDGYNAWLRVINQDSNNVRAMVDGFMNSVEYRLRFGQ